METGTQRSAGVAGPVVVGVDRLDEARAAVTWAAREAAQHGVALRIVHAASHPAVDVAAGGYSPVVLDQIDEAARRELEEAAAHARDTARVEVITRLVHAHPREGLLEAAQGARLLVTGARRRSRLRAGSFAGFQLGSTSLFLASHATCPTAVVRGLPAPGSAARVVVGVDGSDEAVAALRWAARHAVAVAAALTVVTVWQVPVGSPLGGDVGAWEDLRAAAREVAHDQVEEAVALALHEAPGLLVRGEVVQDDHPADALLAAAADASLLVTGSRGRGAFAAALLGSTSHAVLHRARGPVVVVTAGTGGHLRAPGGTAAPQHV